MFRFFAWLVLGAGLILGWSASAFGSCDPARQDVTAELVEVVSEAADALRDGCLQAATTWVVENYFPGENPTVVEGVSDDKFGFWNPVTNKLSMAPFSEFVDAFGEREALMWYVGTLAHEMEHRAQGRVANAVRIFDVTDATHERIEEFEASVRRHFWAEGFDTAEFCAR